LRQERRPRFVVRAPTRSLVVVRGAVPEPPPLFREGRNAGTLANLLLSLPKILPTEVPETFGAGTQNVKVSAPFSFRKALRSGRNAGTPERFGTLGRCGTAFVLIPASP
jgi:hypothetical protein